MPDDFKALPTFEQTRSGEHQRNDLPIYEFDAAHDRFIYAYRDVKSALSNPRLLISVIRKAFAGRYENTLIGPFWVTVSAAMTICGLAILYGKIFGAPLDEYFPYVACGIIVYGLISSIFNGGANAFAQGAGTFDQMPIAKSVFAFRSLGNAFLAFLYKMPVLIPALLIVGRIPSSLGATQAVLGVLLILWTGFWCTLILGTIGMRFKDVGQAINAFMSAVFFFTPVFWQAPRLREYAFIIDYNPFYHYLHIVRGALLGQEGVVHSFIWAGSCSAIVTVLGALTFGLFARRLSYWK